MVTTKTVVAPNISCGHCVMAIKRELNELEGVQSVEGDPGTKKVSVSFDDSIVTWDAIRATMTEINYPPEE